MNREIKFRAWIKPCTTEPFVIESGYMATQGMPDLETLSSFMHHYSNEEHLMQYTGLKDKNGTEVYEGDLCKVCINTGGISDRKKGFMDGVVEYEYGKYQINPYKYTGDIISVMGEGKIYGKTKVELRNPETIEVIGNIYETPELLNSDKKAQECDASKAEQGTNADNQKKTIMNRFNTGDKARVIGNTEEGDTYHRFKIGASVTIVNKDGKYDFVCKDKTGAKQVIAARDLEPIEPVQEEESEERWRTIALTLIQENESLESTISRLKSEIEELKRKA